MDPFTASAGGLALAIKLWLLHHGVSIGVFKIAALVKHNAWIISVGIKFLKFIVALKNGNDKEALRLIKKMLFSVGLHEISVAINFISDCVDDDTARQIKRTFNRIKNQL
jgi:hypothetical protein